MMNGQSIPAPTIHDQINNLHDLLMTISRSSAEINSQLLVNDVNKVLGMTEPTASPETVAEKLTDMIGLAERIAKRMDAIASGIGR